MAMYTQEEYQEAVHKLFDGLNGPEKWVEKLLIEELKNQHPTIQQSFWRVMKGVIFEYSETPVQWTDARNKDSVEFCRRIANNESGAMLVGLPFV